MPTSAYAPDGAVIAGRDPGKNASSAKTTPAIGTFKPPAEPPLAMQTAEASAATTMMRARIHPPWRAIAISRVWPVGASPTYNERPIAPGLRAPYRRLRVDMPPWSYLVLETGAG
jgi:hypothetical protein